MDMNKIQTGVVESIDDPTFAGRIKVRVQGLHDNIPTESLPWCNYSGPGGGQLFLPEVGEHVRVKFSQDDINNMEWYGTNSITRELAQELATDYKGSRCVLYDPKEDISIKYQRGSGLIMYYKGSYVQITPDNTITVHYGPEDTTCVQIQLTDGKIYLQSTQQINITSGNEINLEAKTINLNAENNIKLKGDSPNNCMINGTELITLLSSLATIIDSKLGASSAGMAQALVLGAKEKIMDQKLLVV